MISPVDKLKERVLGGKGKSPTDLTHILDMAREMGCVGEIIGRDFEVRNKNDEVLYTVHQKPMAIKQLNTLLKEFALLKRLDAEREEAKWGKGKGLRK